MKSILATVLLVAAGLATGCSGSSDGPSCKAVKSVAETTTDGRTCEACLEADCCDEASACLGEPECVAIERCWNACANDDSACRYRCASSHPEGMTQWTSVRDCSAANCLWTYQTGGILCSVKFE
jgi:hypothetical protein